MQVWHLPSSEAVLKTFYKLGFTISGVRAGSKQMENVELVQLGKKHRIRHSFAGVSLVLKRFNKRKLCR